MLGIVWAWCLTTWGVYRGLCAAMWGQVLEHGDEFAGCTDSGGERRVDTSGRRAALLEGAMTSTISHPNVRSVQGFMCEGH